MDHPTISVSDLTKRFGDLAVLRHVDLRVPAGAVLVLLGPSGCGKTTLLRTIAGLERADAGEVRIDGRLVSGSAVHVAPQRRRVGMVFQEWALFPHLSVAGNVAYGLPRARRRDPQAIAAVLRMVGLEGVADRPPSLLSGGQQQRVALARALAPEPAVLLLDEPFSNLDATLRAQVRADVHRLLLQLGITAVFVTHDQDEAFVLGDEVAVMREGCIVQQASPVELYARPVDPWVASFVGVANLLPGSAAGEVAASAIGPVPLERAHHGDVVLLVRPEELRLAPGNDATVDLVEYHGHDCLYTARLDAGPSVRVRHGSAPAHRPGDRVAVAHAGPPAMAYPREAAGAVPAGQRRSA